MAKSVGVFAEKTKGQAALNEIVDRKLGWVRWRKLSDRFEEEIMQETVFTSKDFHYALVGGMAGGILLGALFYLQARMIFSFPLLAPLSSAGQQVAGVLGMVVGFGLGAVMGALIALATLLTTDYSQHFMVSVVYSPVNKKDIYQIFRKGNGHVY